MEETDKIDPDFLKGFNDGYLIAKYEPELAERLSKIKAASPHILGMQQGREQLLKEQLQGRMPSLFKESPKKKNIPSKNRDIDIDRD